MRGRTVLMVTHDPAEAARLSDRIAVLTPTGLTLAEAPDSPAPRLPDAPQVLACQGALMARLMAQDSA